MDKDNNFDQPGGAGKVRPENQALGRDRLPRITVLVHIVVSAVYPHYRRSRRTNQAHWTRRFLILSESNLFGALDEAVRPAFALYGLLGAQARVQPDRPDSLHLPVAPSPASSRNIDRPA